jgi:hypothetical protein
MKGDDMLIDESAVLQIDPILAMVGSFQGNNSNTRLQQGVYQISHFGSSHFLRHYEHYPELTIEPYGVCDTVEQILAACPELQDADRRFVLTVTPVRKSHQPSEGGWRWHKWGPYIGTRKPTTEYLYDEPEIDEVLVYHIYEYAS